MSGPTHNGDESHPSSPIKTNYGKLRSQDSVTRIGGYLKNSPQLFSQQSSPISESVFHEVEEEKDMLGRRSPPSLVDDTSVPRKLRARANSVDLTQAIGIEKRDEARVLVLYTGGTIGMVRNKDGALAPFPHALEDRIRATITMHDDNYSKTRFAELKSHMEDLSEDVVNATDSPRSTLFPLVLPHVPDHRRIIYAIYEYDPLLDSSNMTMDDWILIAKDIKRSYKYFDGFVVLHGTDTLAYTASALSFMLEHLGKPVIVTGSQIPCFETRSDGRDNFVGALIIAGNYSIPEVCVYFRHQLMRGNRTIKMSSGDLDAFQSPNMRPLALAGIDIEVDYRSIHRPQSIEKFRAQTKLDRNVVLLRLFPSIAADTIAHFLKPPIKGVVLQCYGAGNVPSNRKDILTRIQEATKRGVLIVSVSQCVAGGVSGLYETGKVLLDAGVICGLDMTTETALSKLSYVLAKKEWDTEKKRVMMQTNIAGEVTVLGKKDRRGALSNKNQDDVDQGEMELIQAVAKCLSIKTSDEMENMKEVLFPSLLCAAVYKGTLSTITEMKTFGADVAVGDYDKRTPLHIAAAEGKLEMVEYLMKSGGSVHARDRNNHTPLRCAIDAGFVDVVRLLVDCGAHLQLSHTELGEEISGLARRGKKHQLHCYGVAGADMETKNMSGGTALHSAVECNQLEIVAYLLEKAKVGIDAKNIFGQTAVDVAIACNRSKIFSLLEEVKKS